MIHSLSRVGGFGAFVARRFANDRCLQIASSLTYTTLLALVPVFTIIVAMLSAMERFENVTAQIKAFLLRNLVPEIANRIITVYMEQVASNAARLTYVSLAGLFVMVILMLLTVDRAFNSIWRAQRRRPFWMAVLGYVLLMLFAPLLLALSMSATSYFMSISFGVMRETPYATVALLKLVSTVGTTITFALIYSVVPSRHVPLRHALLGGLFAAVLFESMKHFFGIYITRVPTYNLIYGTFAAIPLFLVWIYLSWITVLLGAEVAAALGYWQGDAWRRAGQPEAALHDGLEVLRELVAARRANEEVTLLDLKRRLPLPVDRIEDVLDTLLDTQLIEKHGTLQPRYRLVRAPEEISVADAYRMFVLPRGERRARREKLGDLDPLLDEIADNIERGMQRPLSDVFKEMPRAVPAPVPAPTKA